jgi:hypothetical protein
VIRKLHEIEKNGPAEARSHGIDYRSLQGRRVSARMLSKIRGTRDPYTSTAWVLSQSKPNQERAWAAGGERLEPGNLHRVGCEDHPDFIPAKT